MKECAPRGARNGIFEAATLRRAAMLLYVEALCVATTATQTRVPLAHLLGGTAFALLGGAPWANALVGVLLPLAVAAARRGADDVGARAALSLFFWLGLALGALLARAADAKRAVASVRRYACLGALSLLAAWHIDDMLCVSRFPVGLVVSFVLWLGAAFADMWVWAPSIDYVDAHIYYVGAGVLAYALAGPRFVRDGDAMWAQVAVAAGVAALGGAAVLLARPRARPKRA